MYKQILLDYLKIKNKGLLEWSLFTIFKNLTITSIILSFIFLVKTSVANNIINFLLLLFLYIVGICAAIATPYFSTEKSKKESILFLNSKFYKIVYRIFILNGSTIFTVYSIMFIFYYNYLISNGLDNLDFTISFLLNRSIYFVLSFLANLVLVYSLTFHYVYNRYNYKKEISMLSIIKTTKRLVLSIFNLFIITSIPSIIVAILFFIY